LIVKERLTPRIQASCAYVGVAVLTLLYLFPFVRVLWRIGDEGTFVYGAHRVLHGQLPGRDFFEPMGPGSFYWLAAFFRLFGESIGTCRSVLLLTGVALTILTLFCSRRIAAPAIVPVLFTTVLCIPLWPGTSHHWDSNLFALAAFSVFLVWQRSRRPALLAICGILSGFCFSVLQPKGILLCGAFMISAWLLDRFRFRRSIAILLLSFAVVPFAICLFYSAQGALGDVIRASVVWPALHYGAVNRVPYAFGLAQTLREYRPVFEPVMGRTGAVLFCDLMAAPIVIAVCLPGLLAIAALALRRRAFSSDLLPFWVSGAALWLSEMKRPDEAHILFGSLIWLILLCALLHRLPGARLTSATAAFSLSLFGLQSLAIPLQASTRIETRRGVLYAFRPERALSALIANTSVGEFTLVYPYCPLYYFLSGTENATPLSVFIYGYNTPDQFRSAIENLKEKSVRLVLWDARVSGASLTQWFPQYREPANRDLLMERYLTSHYRQSAFEDGFRFLERDERK
jgi:hypothetical protein